LVVGIAHDVAAGHLLGASWCAEAALVGHHANSSACAAGGSACSPAILGIAAEPGTWNTAARLRSAKDLSGSSVFTSVAIEWDFSTANDNAVVLRNTNEGLYLNLPEAPATTATLNIFLEWSEE
jgi:hypothetical protein